MMETYEQKRRARADRDALIRSWQEKSDAKYRPARKRGFVRSALRILKDHPGSVIGDAAFIVMLFGATYALLLVTGSS